MNSVHCLYALRGAKNAKGRFVFKVHFSQRKSATKFFSVKTVSDKIVGHSLPYLTVFWSCIFHPCIFGPAFLGPIFSSTAFWSLKLDIIGPPFSCFAFSVPPSALPCRLWWLTNRKSESHTGFRLVPKSVTLNTLNGVMPLFCVISPNSITPEIVFHFGRNWPTLQRDVSVITALVIGEGGGV